MRRSIVLAAFFATFLPFFSFFFARLVRRIGRFVVPAALTCTCLVLTCLLTSTASAALATRL